MIKKAILQGNTTDLVVQLKDRPELANRAIAFGPAGQHWVHPLHFVCDAVFEGKLSETIALELAKALVEQGADVNGKTSGLTTQDPPLIAAASLYCEKIAVFLIDQGAELQHRGTHGGTALHWAAWTGSDQVVDRLLQESPPLDDQGDEFRSTPLLWAINGWFHPHERNHRHQPTVIGLLLKAGADPNLPNADGRRAMDILLEKDQTDLINLLQQYDGRPS